MGYISLYGCRWFKKNVKEGEKIHQRTNRKQTGHSSHTKSPKKKLSNRQKTQTQNTEQTKRKHKTQTQTQNKQTQTNTEQ